MSQEKKPRKLRWDRCSNDDSDFQEVKRLVCISNRSLLARETGVHLNTVCRIAKGFPASVRVVEKLKNYFLANRFGA
jgi:hypothetical protein